MKCSKCSKDYDDSFEFCPYCAEPKLDLTQTTPPAPPPEEEVSQQTMPPEEEAAVPTEVAAITEKKPPRFSKKTKGVAAVVIILLVVGLAVGLTVGLSGGGNKTETTSTNVSVNNSNMTFTNENWNEVCSNASGFQGAKVEGLVGKIFVAPEASGGGVAIQMFADPANSAQATIVYYYGSGSSQYANGDLIKVDGTVEKEFKGQNAMGGTITDPTINATSVTKTDATALIKGGKNVTVTQQQDQNGVVVIVDKMVLRDNETDVFVRVKNNQPSQKAHFYAYNAKLQAGNQQFDEDSSKSNQYGQMPSDILPGVEVQGILVFPTIGTPVPSTGAVALHLEASSENYMANFNPYVFNISW